MHDLNELAHANVVAHRRPPRRRQRAQYRQQRQVYDPLAYGRAPTNGLGVAAFVLGIIGVVTGGLAAPLALIFGAASMGQEPKGLAIAGFVLGIVGSLGFIVMVSLFGIGFCLIPFSA